MSINGARFFDMYFEGFGVNPTVNTAEEPFSTFSVDTDTASYSVTRAYLERSSLPDEAAVRVMDFDHPPPAPSEPKSRATSTPTGPQPTPP